MAIEDYLTLELVPILLDMVVLHHDDYHIDIGEELVEIVVLVLHDVFLNEGVIDLEGTGERGCQGTGPWHRVFSSLEFLYQSSPNSGESFQLAVGR